jgi:uroporphyrinogen-III decarboxylase
MRRVFASFNDKGYVVLRSGITTIPFEFFCGGRSMQKFVLDLHRMPDRVQAAMDAIMPEVVQAAINSAHASGIPSLWVGGWRSASALLSPRLWNRFVFPYLLQLTSELIDNGITPVLHLDQDWGRDLARFRELPARKCVLNLDGATDIRRAKEVLGDHMAILGDVPPSLFVAGTPDDIHAYVRDLIRGVGPTGLLLCPGCDAPINTKPENMEALVAAAHEYGKVASQEF